MEALIPILIVAAILLIPLIWLIANYNRMASLRQHIRESWSDIDVEMKRRYELIPNLVETVRGYAKHERDVLEMVVQLRNKAVASTASATDHAVAEPALQIGVKRLLAV